MNPGKEEEKEREGGDVDEVGGGGAFPASPWVTSMTSDGTSLRSGMSAWAPIPIAIQLRLRG